MKNRKSKGHFCFSPFERERQRDTGREGAREREKMHTCGGEGGRGTEGEGGEARILSRLQAQCGPNMGLHLTVVRS